MKKSLALQWKVLIAIILATIIGKRTGTDHQLFGVTYYAIFDFAGTLFLNALKMLIVPLIASSIIVGISGVGSSKHLGRLGLKTFSFYLLSSLLAIFVGLLLVNIIKPGIIDINTTALLHMNLATDQQSLSAVMKKVSGKGVSDIVDVFLRMVPVNIVSAASKGQMLGLIFFSLLFGFFMTKTNPELYKTTANFWKGVFETMMHITQWVMKFAPYGVFALVAKTVASTGFEAFKPIFAFFITVLLALVIHLFFVLFLLLRVVGQVNPVKHFKIMLPVLLTAFSTASSAATLPLTLEAVEHKSGVSNRTTSFVLPLGATVNMDGTALYECVAALFIAQVYGLDLTFVQQFLIVVVALLTSIGVAGIPAASLVAISVILGVIGLPLEGIGLLLITDRFLDMCRTAVNVFSDSCGAVIIARLEGEKTNLL